MLYIFIGMFCFPLGSKGALLLGVPNLFGGGRLSCKNEGCLLEAFIMRLFNQTLSIYTLRTRNKITHHQLEHSYWPSLLQLRMAS